MLDIYIHLHQPGFLLVPGFFSISDTLNTATVGWALGPYPTLAGLTPLPCSPSDCLGRQYNRLNQDYRLLHHLCRFFLENTGPTYQQGDRAMVPFLVDMERLYELFVAEWLKPPYSQNIFSQAATARRPG